MLSFALRGFQVEQTMCGFGVVPEKSVVAGTWYYGVTCLSCLERIVLFKDVADGERARPFEVHGTFQLWCPHCHEAGEYGAGHLESCKAVFTRR
jgi:hypothetical protein